jgi:gliding motility-associated-like protein
VVILSVTAQNGEVRTYSIAVYKNGSNITGLRGLTSNYGLYNSLTGPGDFNFGTVVGGIFNEKLKVFAYAMDVREVITINGTVVESGVAYEVDVSQAPRFITVLVTAQNGDKKTYVITVHRGSILEGFSSSIVPADSNNPAIVVHKAVSPNGDGINDFLKIDGIENYPDNNLTIINRAGTKVYEVKGYDNSSRAFPGYSNNERSKSPVGTYYYVLQYHDSGQLKTLSGYFVLKY